MSIHTYVMNETIRFEMSYSSPRNDVFSFAHCVLSEFQQWVLGTTGDSCTAACAAFKPGSACNADVLFPW